MRVNLGQKFVIGGYTPSANGSPVSLDHKPDTHNELRSASLPRLVCFLYRPYPKGSMVILNSANVGSASSHHSTGHHYDSFRVVAPL